MDRPTDNRPPGEYAGWDASENADPMAFRASMRDDPPAPGLPGPMDEGGPVAIGRIELGYPFEDADVLADLFLDGSTTVARIGPEGVVPAPVVAPVSVTREAYFAERRGPVAGQSGLPGSTEKKRLVEVLLVGHLPVLGSAWVMQYAKHVAQQSGEAVGLVRLSGDEASIDLALPPSVAPPASGPMPGVNDAVRFVGERTKRWIVRLDDAAERTTPAEIEKSIAASDRVTILTGADEAAVVACYRVLKHLSLGEDGPQVHVAVMGTPGARADESAGKLSRAAEKFLSRRVGSEVCSARITPGSSVNVYRGRPDLGHAELMELLGQGGGLSTAPKASMASAGEPTAPSGPAATSETEERPLAPAFDPRVERLALRNLARDIAANTDATAAERTNEVVAETSRPATVAAAPVSTGGLARHLDSLESLPTRCPYAPEVELAIDPQGTMHLIASVKGDPGRVLGELTTARDWAVAHASLLAMAHPRARGGGMICHLLTDSPKSVRRLGDGGLRLHLLTAPPGTAPDEAGWVCVELN